MFANHASWFVHHLPHRALATSTTSIPTSIPHFWDRCGKKAMSQAKCSTEREGEAAGGERVRSRSRRTRQHGWSCIFGFRIALSTLYNGADHAKTMVHRNMTHDTSVMCRAGAIQLDRSGLAWLWGGHACMRVGRAISVGWACQQCSLLQVVTLCPVMRAKSRACAAPPPHHRPWG